MDSQEELIDRSNLMKLSKEQIIDYFSKLSKHSTDLTNISAQLKELSGTIDSLQTKLEASEGQLAITRNANKLLAARVDKLENNIVNNTLSDDAENRMEDLERCNLNCQQYIRNSQLENNVKERHHK